VSSICSIGSNENARGCETGSADTSLPAISDGKKSSVGSSNNGSQKQKTGRDTFESFKKDPIGTLKQMYNDFTSIGDGKQLSGSGGLNDRARLAKEGDLIGGSNESNQTDENRQLGKDLHTTGVVAKVSGEVIKEQAPGIVVIAVAPELVPVRWLNKLAPLLEKVGLKAGESAATAEVAGVRGSSRALYSNAEIRKIAKDLGLKQVGKSGELPIFLNKGAGAKYLVPSRTSHTGDAFKGFNSLKEAQMGKPGKAFREGSYDASLKRIGD
jgi:Novel toxin 21